MTEIVVGFAGMTHLGINSAVATAAHDFAVVGYDNDAALIDRLKARQLPIVEPGLDALVVENAARLSFTAEVRDLGACDVVYIAIDVPTDDQGQSDLSPVRALIERVAPQLKFDAVLVVLCQVPPGFTRALQAVPHNRLIYQVETLIFGRAVERALKPERFIVGCSDPMMPLPPKYRALLEAFNCPILLMRYESAELAKISINFCLVASVSVANTLAELCEAVEADWSEIIPALKLDRRIGQYSYLNPGLGIAGGNLERDLRTVLDLAATQHTDAGVVKAWVANSQYRKDWCWRTLEKHVLAKNPGARIGVLGLAYKENTHSTKNSAALLLLSHLKGREVRVHDPVVLGSIVPFAKECRTPLDCADGVDALVVATPWPQFRDLKLVDLASRMSGRVLIDPYRMLDGRAAVNTGFAYFALGMPSLQSSRC